MYYRKSVKFREAVRGFAVSHHQKYDTVYSQACHAQDLIKMARIQQRGNRWAIIGGGFSLDDPWDCDRLCFWALKRAGFLWAKFNAYDNLYILLLGVAEMRLKTLNLGATGPEGVSG